MLFCGYCDKNIEEAESYFDCTKCLKKIHLKCLRRGNAPSGILGDVFYNFICYKCSENHSEVFERKHVSWITAIILALYNLSVHNQGISFYGYFHFKSNISYFIEKHWKMLFGDPKKRKVKKWIGCVAGCLSQNSPELFVSGTQTVGEAGWWRLSQKHWTPRKFVEYYQTLKKKEKRTNLPIDPVTEVTDNIETNDVHNHQPEDAKKTISCLENLLRTNDDLFYERQTVRKIQQPTTSSSSVSSHVEPDEIQNDNNFSKLNCEASLFTKSRKREYPWKKSLLANVQKYSNDICEFMSEADEDRIFSKLKKLIDNEEASKITVPESIRRYYCKLRVRRMKRKFGQRNFLQKDLNFPATTVTETETNQRIGILDRFCVQNSGISFQSKIVGSISHEPFESPYTARILHPFIFRDKKMMPMHVKLLCELQYRVNQKIPERASIDFCFVRPQHIPAINCLLQSLFWPGIDMSESLDYPDFTVVALYKKLVVGCAFLVPDMGHNEAYISFLAVRPNWQRAGIATFMLYHLTQTCPGKDITLHVSVDNPAICFYQKFGFKTEEFVFGFYEKYLPIQSHESSAMHAIFLRLSR